VDYSYLAGPKRHTFHGNPSLLLLPALSFPFSSSCFPSPPYPLPPLEVDPLNTARGFGLGSDVKAPSSESGAEPQRKSNLVHSGLLNFYIIN